MNQDIEIVTRLKQGKDLAKSGRMVQAEKHFRYVRTVLPKNDSIRNDLGYSLLVQGRFTEAIFEFREALNLNPSNQAANHNLARAYYQNGNLEAAAYTYQGLIDEREKAIAEGSDDAESLVKLSDLYRQLSVVHYALGYLDEAICLSEKAFSLALSMEETEQHTRMLLSVDRVLPAFQILQSTVAVHRDTVSPDLLMDYGLVLFTIGKFDLADQALLKVLARSGLSVAQKQQIRYLRFVTSYKRASLQSASAGLDAESLAEEVSKDQTVSQIFADLLEVKPDACDGENLDFNSYWPQSFFEQSESLLKRQCTDEWQS